MLVAKNLLANAGDIRDEGLIPGSVRSPEAANDNPLQYSCLENSIDRRTQQATVHRVTNSRTRSKLLSIKSLREHRIYHFWWKSEEQKVAWKKMCGSREGIREEEISSVTIVRKPGKKIWCQIAKNKGRPYLIVSFVWISPRAGPTQRKLWKKEKGTGGIGRDFSVLENVNSPSPVLLNPACVCVSVYFSVSVSVCFCVYMCGGDDYDDDNA